MELYEIKLNRQFGLPSWYSVTVSVSVPVSFCHARIASHAVPHYLPTSINPLIHPSICCMIILCITISYHSMYCPSMCSGKGICDWDSPTPTCKCFDPSDQTDGCYDSPFNPPLECQSSGGIVRRGGSGGSVPGMLGSDNRMLLTSLAYPIMGMIMLHYL